MDAGYVHPCCAWAGAGITTTWLSSYKIGILKIMQILSILFDCLGRAVKPFVFRGLYGTTVINPDP